jgi:metal-sulfur cluster biosynthetic enzyme
MASLFLHASCEKIKAVDDQLGALGLLTRLLDAGLVLEMLRQVIDPELGVNIVDLGLVYDVTIAADGNVEIEMTLTTPGCPLGGFLDDQIRACLAQLPQVRGVAVTLVWEPPWDPTAMSDLAREQLGWA